MNLLASITALSLFFLPLNGAMTPTSADFVTVAKKAMPAVVFIKVENAPPQYNYGQDPNDIFNDEFFRRFFGGPPPQQAPQRSQGSGFFISADGYIMTNYHVV